MDVPPARGSENLGSLWQSSSRSLTAQYFLQKSTDALAHEWSSLPTLCFPSSHSATAGTQGSQGTTAQADSNSPPSGGTNRVIPAAESSPVADPLETGPPLSSELHDMSSTAQVMGPECVAARREPFVLPECVLNTIAEARAPSSRRLYALKWPIFSAWCQDRDLDRSPPMCQWFFHFCRGCWINSVPHPASKFMRKP